MSFFGPFGFRSGRDVDKLAHIAFKHGVTGCPLLSEHALSVLEALGVESNRSRNTYDFHRKRGQFEVLKAGRPMTYHYDHETLKGKSPPNAPTFFATS